MSTKSTEQISAEKAIDIALDNLVSPMTEEFLRDWRDRKDLNSWYTMIHEVQPDFSI